MIENMYGEFPGFFSFDKILLLCYKMKPSLSTFLLFYLLLLKITLVNEKLLWNSLKWNSIYLRENIRPMKEFLFRWNISYFYRNIIPFKQNGQITWYSLHLHTFNANDWFYYASAEQRRDIAFTNDRVIDQQRLRFTCAIIYKQCKLAVQ